MEELHKVLLETFKAFVSFCQQHGLRYFACGGTCLGAELYQGFIPWDDDVDVLMPRVDYNKLLEIRHELEGTDYEFLCYLDKRYSFNISRFCSKKCTVWVRKRHTQIIAPFVDVTPIDEATNDVKTNDALSYKYRHIHLNYHRSCMGYPWQMIWRDFCKGYYVDSLVGVQCKLFYAPFEKCFYNKVLKVEEEIQTVKGPFAYYYNHIYSSERETFPKSYFEEWTEVPFEDMIIRVPKEYKAFLKQLYGNYTRDLPEDKKMRRHPYYYMNLHERLTMDEIIRYHCDELDERESYSIKSMCNYLYKEITLLIKTIF